MKIDGLKDIIAQDEKGATVTIYQRDGEPYLASDGTEATFTVVGQESKRYRDAKLAQQRRLMKRARAGARDITPEEVEQDVLRLAASAVTDWHGWEDDAGADLPCKPDSILQVIKYTHIFEQVQAAITGHAGFFSNDSGS